MFWAMCWNSVSHDLFMKKQRELKKWSHNVMCWPGHAFVGIRESLPAIRATLRHILAQSIAGQKTEAKAMNELMDWNSVSLLSVCYHVHVKPATISCWAFILEEAEINNTKELQFMSCKWMDNRIIYSVLIVCVSLHFLIPNTRW